MVPVAARTPFRYAAPISAGRKSLLRPRLVSVLAGRFDRRLTFVQAGAGFGKTTLLAQAIEQSRLDRRGRDLWVGCVAADESAEHLASGVAGALGIDDPDPTLDTLVGAVWRLAPDEVALVLDDLQFIPEGSAGMALVVDLVERLPGNGHLVLASRRAPPPALGAAVGVLLSEVDLAFDADEIAAFAASRSVTRETIEASGGWPALAELRADAGEGVAADFLWEEILAALDPPRREAIERLLPFASFDDEIVEAVTGLDVPASVLARDLPLADRDGEAVRLHDLWQRAGSRRPEVDGGIRRGAEVLQRRGQFRVAFDVLDRVGDDEGMARLVAHLATVDLPELHTDDFAYVLGRAPVGVTSRPHAELLRAQMLLGVDGAGAREALAASAAAFAAAGDVEGEARALAHELWLHAWEADIEAMAEALEGLRRLAGAGSERARRSVDLSSAYVALVSGRPRRAIEIIERSEVRMDPATGPMGHFMLAVAHLDRGEPEQALLEAELGRASARGRLRVGVVGAAFEARLLLGLPDEATVRGQMVELEQLTRAYGVAESLAQVLAGCAIVSAEYGWVDEARRHLDAARQAGAGVGARVRPAITMAEATLRLAVGDEPGAVAVLKAGLAMDPLGDRPDRAYLRSLPTVYLLVPATRGVFDGLDLGPAWAHGRSVAQAMAGVRASDDPAPAAAVDWSDVPRLRATVAGPLIVELVVAALAAGVPAASDTLDELPFDVRPALRRLAASGPRCLEETALALLERVPAVPRETIEIRVLGSLELRRADKRVVDPAWARDRVRALVLRLVDRRRVSRRRLAREIWPDLDEGAAADNLRVNLKHLQRVLQPDRLADEPPWFVLADGEDLVLSSSPHLVIDVDAFERSVAAGRDAEAALDPVRAIEHYREALARYRGDYLADAPVDDWGEFDRVRLRREYVVVAVRTGELLLARGSAEEAARLGARASEVDPFEESAHRLSARALRLTGDRAGAWRLLSAAIEMLRDEGLEPDPLTLREHGGLTDAG